MTVLIRQSQALHRQHHQRGSEAAGQGIVERPRCQAPPALAAEVPSSSESHRGHSHFVSSLEKTADEISQDPLRYSRLRRLTRRTQSERARTFLDLADESREQRWIELERTRVGEPRRPLVSEPRRPRVTLPQIRPAAAARTMREVQRALADEDDEAPLLPRQRDGGGDSD